MGGSIRRACTNGNVRGRYPNEKVMGRRYCLHLASMMYLALTSTSLPFGCVLEAELSTRGTLENALKHGMNSDEFNYEMPHLILKKNGVKFTRKGRPYHHKKFSHLEIWSSHRRAQ